MRRAAGFTYVITDARFAMTNAKEWKLGCVTLTLASFLQLRFRSNDNRDSEGVRLRVTYWRQILWISLEGS